MNKVIADFDKPAPGVLLRITRAWNGFWFTPADPTILGLMRLTCGLVTLYTMFIYSFNLQEFMGEHAWYDLSLRMEIVRDRGMTPTPLDNQDYSVQFPSNPEEGAYFDNYRTKWGILPPEPYPTTKEQADYIDLFLRLHGMDPRRNGLPPPSSAEETRYLEEYTNRHGGPPPEYELDPEKQKEIDNYIARHSVDPRRVYTRGVPVWSMWFHVTDPTVMAIIHGLVVFITFLFTIGFCTRVTAPLTWMAALWYIHRNFIVLFGVDTMMNILLLYLAIGPSGAAFSVDRLISRWWSKNKFRVVNRWDAFLGKPAIPLDRMQPAHYSAQPEPSVSANFAIRLLQVHLCIIYLISGLSKLQGNAWWNGTAVWGTLANYEFAPMQYEAYNWFLRKLAQKHFLFQLFMTGAGLFTLAFEISYAFLIWRPSMRWVVLTGAILLHGGIGLFMGLKTFSLLMLVLNLVFVRPQEVRSLIAWFRGFFDGPPPSDAAPRLKAKFVPTPSSRPIVESAPAGSSSAGSSAFKEKKK